jgi:uncharacterized membrane protein YkvA (DUF1232 family)
MDKRPTGSIIPSQGGVLRDITLRAKLFLRLLGDKRVSLWAKLIPIGALAYLISPVDLIMGIPGVSALDDAAILWLGYYTFIEMCPPDVVRELSSQLVSNNAIVEDVKKEAEKDADDVVEGEATDIK